MQAGTTYSEARARCIQPLRKKPVPKPAPRPADAIGEVFWKIHKERRKRERDLEFKPGCTIRQPLAITEEKRQEMVSQAFVLECKAAGLENDLSNP